MGKRKTKKKTQKFVYVVIFDGCIDVFTSFEAILSLFGRWVIDEYEFASNTYVTRKFTVTKHESDRTCEYTVAKRPI